MNRDDSSIQGDASWKSFQVIETFQEMDEVFSSPAMKKKIGGVYGPEARDKVFLLGGTIMNLTGEEHRRRRLLDSALVSRQALKGYESSLVATIQGRLAELPVGPDQRARTNIVKFVRNIALEIAARLIGLDDMGPLQRLEHLGELGDRLVGSLKAEFEFEDEPQAPSSGPPAARQNFITRRIDDALAAKQEFVEAFYRPARERREMLVAKYHAGQIAEAELLPDLITQLILHDAELRAEPSWDKDLAVRECVVMLAASDHTTAMSTCHAIVDLLEWTHAHPEDAVKLGDVKFLRRGIQESLRLHQVTDPSPSLRTAQHDVVLSSGRPIAAGETVAVWLRRGSRDPLYYGEDADQFNPYRQDRGKRRRPYGFAFGGGEHVCLGQSLAMGVGDGEEIKGDIALILQTLFERGMEPDPDSPPTPKSHTFSDDGDVHQVIYVWSTFPVVFSAPVSTG